MTELSAAAPGSPPGDLPLLWHPIHQRVQAQQAVPRGLLLRVLGSPQLVRTLIQQAQAGMPTAILAQACGLAPAHGALVQAALLREKGMGLARPGAEHPERADQIRRDIELGVPLEEVVSRHHLSQAELLQYVVRLGLKRLAHRRRQQARVEVQALIERQAEVPLALLATATGVASDRVQQLVQALQLGQPLMRSVQELGMTWAAGRLIAQAIRWRQGWRHRERRVGRLTLAEVLSRAQAQQDPVWIAEAAGVRVQWIRQVLRRHAPAGTRARA